MKKIFAFIKTTHIGGLFFIIPIVLVVIVFGKILDILRKLVEPIAENISISIFGEHALSRIIAIVIIVFVCFIAGLLQEQKKQAGSKNGLKIIFFLIYQTILY